MSMIDLLNQFSIIQNLQMSPIPQTSFLVGIFGRFLQQDSSSFNPHVLGGNFIVLSTIS